MLLFGCLVPLPLIAASYLFIIKHLRRKPNGFVSSYTARAVHSIFRVVIFHFLCWTPFWIIVMLLLLSHFGLLSIHHSLLDLKATKFFRMVTSFLLYLNSALNWIFYGIMNRQLRESISLMTGRHSRMPLSSLPNSGSISSQRRSTRSLIASSRL